ncbi:hypothetical protein BGZ95_007185, partial [Linnemannia exigua]
MDPLSKLPIEHLQRILDFITLLSTTAVYHPGCLASTHFPVFTPYHQTSLSTFAALCRVNKHIASVTLPYLYRDPFQAINNQGCYYMARNWSRDLLLTLIKFFPAVQLHPALLLPFKMNATPATTSTDSNIDTNPSHLGYLAHIRHFNLQPFAFVEYERYKRKECSAAEQEYIQQPEFLDIYLKGRRDTICRRRAMSDTIVECYTALLHREATWSLAGPILEQLESSTFPLSDIRRYLQVIDRLGRLERVHFLLDWNLTCLCCGGSYQYVEKIRKQCEDQAMGQLIQFVRDHGRLFPGRLMHVNASLSHYLSYSQDIPKETLREILRILPPLYKITSINNTNWPRIAPHLQTTDFSHVRFIDRSAPMAKFHQVLQQCRSLCNISTNNLVPKSFDWAVKEKRDMLERPGQGTVYPVPTGRCVGALSSQATPLTHEL